MKRFTQIALWQHSSYSADNRKCLTPPWCLRFFFLNLFGTLTCFRSSKYKFTLVVATLSLLNHNLTVINFLFKRRRESLSTNEKKKDIRKTTTRVNLPRSHFPTKIIPTAPPWLIQEVIKELLKKTKLTFWKYPVKTQT